MTEKLTMEGWNRLSVIVVVQLISHVWLWNPTNYCMLGSSVLRSFLEFAQIHVHWVSDFICLILCHCLCLLPSIFPSIRVFSNESALCISWPKYWSFSFSISSSNEYSWLISYRINWFDLLAVQRTIKNLLQHPIWKHQLFGTQPSL